MPASPINNVPQVMAHPQVLAREMLVKVLHPTAGELTMAGIPIKLSETPGAMRMPAPTLGQHTEEVLRDMLGYTPEQIAELRAEGTL